MNMENNLRPLALFPAIMAAHQIARYARLAGRALARGDYGDAAAFRARVLREQEIRRQEVARAMRAEGLRCFERLAA